MKPLMHKQQIAIIRACLVTVVVISLVIILSPFHPDPDCPQCLVANYGPLMGTILVFSAGVGLLLTHALSIDLAERG